VEKGKSRARSSLLASLSQRIKKNWAVHTKKNHRLLVMHAIDLTQQARPCAVTSRPMALTRDDASGSHSRLALGSLQSLSNQALALFWELTRSTSRLCSPLSIPSLLSPPPDVTMSLIFGLPLHHYGLCCPFVITIMSERFSLDNKTDGKVFLHKSRSNVPRWWMISPLRVPIAFHASGATIRCHYRVS